MRERFVGSMAAQVNGTGARVLFSPTWLAAVEQSPGVRGVGGVGRSRAGAKNGDCHQLAPVMTQETEHFV